MRCFKACSIREVVMNDLEQILTWRNHPAIRRYMLTQHRITLDEHVNWFMRASNDPLKRLLIVEENRQAFGFIQFSGVARDAVANWGFYTVPRAPKGSGWKLGVTALDFAFQELALRKICGQALDLNEPSIRFHRMLGFQQEGVLREHHKIGRAYHNLICFGLLRHEWAKTELRRVE